MNIAIVGLGLIGGSMARAYSKYGHQVWGEDRDENVMSLALWERSIAGRLTPELLGQCDLILLALYTRQARDYLSRIAPRISSKTLVMDLCGTKQEICELGFALAEEYGFAFVGGHPMAGTHHSGYSSGWAELFRGAYMIVVPPAPKDEALLARVEQAMAPMGFAGLTVTDAACHDRVIAYTSQLPHVISSAYIKSPRALERHGYSAGSFQDMSRVAKMNADMWTDLFLENRENLGEELDGMISQLTQYRKALAQEDGETLHRLLSEGNRRKEQVEAQ